MEVTLHPAPRWRDVVLEQVRIVGLILRPAAFVVVVVLGVATVAIAVDILAGGPGFDSRDVFPTPLISFFLPFAVWRSDKRFGPSFLWTLPVDRRRLALAKVLAGWVWLMVTLAFLTGWLLALGLLAHASPARTVLRLPVTETIAAYLVGSALVLGLRHPLMWLAGAAGLFLLLGGVSQLFEEMYGVETLLGSRGLFFAVVDAWTTWRALPGLTQWAIGTVLSCGAGLAALWAAASRHRERKRR
jgi:hypothetical protein